VAQFPLFIKIIIILLLVLAPGISLYADLDDFGNAVKEDQEKPAEEDEPEPERDENDELSEAESEFWTNFYALTIGLWVMHNLSSWYAPYPYSGSTQGVKDTGHNYDLLEYTSDSRPQLKQNRMSVYISGGWFFQGTGTGHTASARVTGKFLAAFGIDLEYRWWGDGSGNLYFLRAGGLLPIIQSDIFSLDLAMAGAFYYDLFSLSGFSFGGIIKSYPVKPISLELRGGGIFSSAVNFAEVGFKLGFHINRLELFAGYYGLFHSDIAINAIDAGIGLHF
jgi:hypothetical protein